MKGLVFAILLFSFITSNAQPYQFILEFKDKANNPFTIDVPEAFLSERSIHRRMKQGIAITEVDLPITPDYITDLQQYEGIVIKSKSKWFNDVVIEIEDTVILDKIKLKDYVVAVTGIPSTQEKRGGRSQKELDLHVTNITDQKINTLYGSAYNQIGMLRGDYLHITGSKGEDLLIGVIDAGFRDMEQSPHFVDLFKQKRILAHYDFVGKDENVYDHSLHGTYVMSIMASNNAGVMIGTAPVATYLLLRSEDSDAEYLTEEFYWVEAAEFADSAGADILNTSLGYTTFDDSLQNHSHSDLDGKTTRISMGAEMAASKGMLVFNSAGNSGNGNWGKIGVPADAVHVIAVGGVDSSQVIADFSSRGPSADGRVKPDIVAQGKDVIIGRPDGTVGKSNGTSFASPMMAGMAACLWQANPERTADQVRKAIILSANRFVNPDSAYGYGMPDFMRADRILKGQTISNESENELLGVFPNPFANHLIVTLYAANSEEGLFRIYGVNGKLISETRRGLELKRETFLYFNEDFLPASSGVYILKILVGGDQFEAKIVR